MSGNRKDPVSAEHDRAWLGRVTKNLSEYDRILLYLLFGHGPTVKEAAARMGIGHDVARQRKSRLLQRLRDQL